ncbi:MULTISPECIES: cryptochrome/photolyase family protein [unclassified Leeuwenhoekiella]|uniref:cryptochrome/photolyase family protein n=1 Tax=unclassified Leeuwenhoekiella TaxID=2615029 RepID=UPI000C6A6BBB|nr:MULTISPECIES: cryptochrome/photolyase family protein [unclassified Leeuwenhoekiella]MAW96606.1 cryptochrome/photolyase family protein [Leeuwenhoekiella sp.]MBA81494.1 cryptochrome/photolyase family protein [Leeuwenhoekiella sp.]
MKTLRFILGDQLNHKHSWYDQDDKDLIYFMAEMRQETDYVKHHIQKVVAFFEAMRNFSKWLEEHGKSVIYFKIDHPDNEQDLVKNIKKLIKAHDIEKFEYQLPDEYRLDEQLKDFCKDLDLETEAYDTEHFLTSRTDLEKFYEGKKTYTMEYFYRDMRKKYKIMMVNDKDPEGGKWNFDQSNRKKWKGKPEIPHERGFRKDVTKTLDQIKEAGVKTIGNIDASSFNWPTSRTDCLSVLNYFCENLLLHFGDYQDAMDPNEIYLFHSRLSFAMNSKMLHPKEVIDKVIEHWREHKDEIDISQVEGFVRQILGWREYMRGMYWMKMPGYRRSNKLDNQNKLPDFYWTADTKMNCMHHAIKQSLDHAYAHHIQRLMITGNYALLTQTHPDEVDEWYLGIYIDAIEWVEITNTRGMSQFADGGLVATKPYVSSGSYINKMSNYCGDCTYSVSKKTSDNACPFNSLYWNFLYEKQKFFKDNQRMNVMMSMLEKKDQKDLEALVDRAQEIIKNPQNF